MPKEKELFRDTLVRLRELYPGREVLTLGETSKLMGLDGRTITNAKNSPVIKVRGRYVVPIIKLASFMS